MINRLSTATALILSNVFALTAFADDTALPAGTAPTSSAAASAPGTGAMLVPFVAMFAIMYFLMIRPQQKRMKAQQSMLSALKEGDEVLTASGILGTVKTISDLMVTLEIDRDVKMKVLKSQVSQIMKDGVATKLA